MSQSNLIKNIAKHSLSNDREKLLDSLNALVEHSKDTRKLNLALQLQSLIKESIKQHSKSKLLKVGSEQYYQNRVESELDGLILEKVTSDYRFSDLIVPSSVSEDLKFLVQEHNQLEKLLSRGLPVSNKILLHGPSGCGKTLASYVLAGELEKMMYVINLGAVVSSKLGQTSKNLAKIFRQAASENCIIFIDEFDSLGKLRDYSQDHGEMKRVVNTVLQLFDYLPQTSLVFCATNQENMIDRALLRRFDFNIKFDYPTKQEVGKLVELVLRNGNFKIKNKTALSKIISRSVGLSYYSIQKTLISTIKKTIFKQPENFNDNSKPILIDVKLWQELIEKEKNNLL